MEHFEMIEKLRDKAGVTREVAADALERANWDMLEALMLLEREGKIPPLTSSVATASPDPGGQTGAGTRYAGVQRDSVGMRIRELFRKSLAYSFIVRRGGREVVLLPVLVSALILIAAFRLSAIALVLGLCFGCRYSVEERAD